MNQGFRWRVFQANLEPVLGSEQGGERPVLVVSREDVNALIGTVTVVPLTSLRPGRRIYPSEVLLPREMAGQPRDSVLLAHQIRTISKSRLKEAYGILIDSELREQVLEAVKLHLDVEELA